MGVALLTSGVILHFTHGELIDSVLSWILLCNHSCITFLCCAAAIPLNKQLYTLSYVCVTSGAAALLFSAFYIMVCYLGLYGKYWKFYLLFHHDRFYLLEYFLPEVNVHLSHLVWSVLCVIAGWYLGFEIIVHAFEMDWHECHACLCHGSWRNLCRIH